MFPSWEVPYNDIIAGGHTQEEVLALYAQSVEIFHQAGFSLRKFLINSKSHQQQTGDAWSQTMQEVIPETEPVFYEATLGTSQHFRPEEHKVLRVL